MLVPREDLDGWILGYDVVAHHHQQVIIAWYELCIQVVELWHLRADAVVLDEDLPQVDFAVVRLVFLFFSFLYFRLASRFEYCSCILYGFSVFNRRKEPSQCALSVFPQVDEVPLGLGQLPEQLEVGLAILDALQLLELVRGDQDVFAPHRFPGLHDRLAIVLFLLFDPQVLVTRFSVIFL